MFPLGISLCRKGASVRNRPVRLRSCPGLFGVFPLRAPWERIVAPREVVLLPSIPLCSVTPGPLPLLMGGLGLCLVQIGTYSEQECSWHSGQPLF